MGGEGLGAGGWARNRGSYGLISPTTLFLLASVFVFIHSAVSG